MILQDIQLQTNHRTHARNLEIAKAVRKILSRSFGVPGNDEHALVCPLIIWMIPSLVRFQLTTAPVFHCVTAAGRHYSVGALDQIIEQPRG